MGHFIPLLIILLMSLTNVVDRKKWKTIKEVHEALHKLKMEELKLKYLSNK